jgi:hypothetical protein
MLPTWSASNIRRIVYLELISPEVGEPVGCKFGVAERLRQHYSFSFYLSSFAMRWTVPVPIPSDLATFKMPIPLPS